MSARAGELRFDGPIRIAGPSHQGSFIIRGEGDRQLLRIDPDGTVTGEIEDASEAAKVFVSAVRQMFGQSS